MGFNLVEAPFGGILVMQSRKGVLTQDKAMKLECDDTRTSKWSSMFNGFNILCAITNRC
jgi:hypothetical protein